MKFLGLAVPGARGMSSLEDLVAVWRVQNGRRFQNYKATFTILKIEKISWKWLNDLVKGIKPDLSQYCPPVWNEWVNTGNIKALQCKTTRIPRKKNEQLPKTEEEKIILNKLFELTHREFEFAAKKIIKLFDTNFISMSVTPSVRDGGRDIIGQYKIGHQFHNVFLDVFVEVKQYKNQGIGVRSMSRLISRIKHRDIGVFITTSYFKKQVQKEIIEDKHPIILISGSDIVKILIKNEIGLNNKKNLNHGLFH